VKFGIGVVYEIRYRASVEPYEDRSLSDTEIKEEMIFYFSHLSSGFG
jgi:hypothetical protein